MSMWTWLRWRWLHSLCKYILQLKISKIIMLLVLNLKDIDECVEGLDGCAHNCTDTDGSYSCDCMDGYLLGENNRDCIGEQI